MEALARGAHVTVVSGPAEVPLPYGADVVQVETACEMADAVLKLAPEADVFIAAAAVADYRVDNPATDKHKRTGRPLTLTLVENPDILAEVGAAKREGQVIVGFAAETQDLIGNAKAKLKKKAADLFVANEVGDPDTGFGADAVRASFIDRAGSVEDLGLITKEDLAEKLIDRVVALLT